MRRMLKTRIRELAKERGIITPYDLHKVTGFTRSMAARLLRDLPMASIKFSTIETLCIGLKCQPGDIFILDRKK
jgi:DNA-binding Xre family transcriptional regulator